MASKACAGRFNERRSEMQNSSESEAVKSNRVFKRALIILAVIEFIVTAVGMFYYVHK